MFQRSFVLNAHAHTHARAHSDDFENGSRGQYPFSVLCFGIPTFFAAGCVVEQAVKVILGENNAGFAVQVGVVGCIWAGVYEIGRLETGDALNTPEIDKEIEVLAGEFDDFAAARLERVSESMSVNQIEVVQSFRRFHSRHRNVEYGGATDTMIEAQLRRWVGVCVGLGASLCVSCGVRPFTFLCLFHMCTAHQRTSNDQMVLSGVCGRVSAGEFWGKDRGEHGAAAFCSWLL